MCIYSRHRKYLSPFFCCIAPYNVESCIFSIQIYFFLHFSFFKKGLHRECKGILEINIIFFTNLELWIKRDFYQTPSHGRKGPMNQGLSVYPSILPSVLPSESFLGIGSLFFLKLSMVLGAHVLLRLTARFFEKTLVAQKMGKIGKKQGFFNLLENLVIFSEFGL